MPASFNNVQTTNSMNSGASFSNIPGTKAEPEKDDKGNLIINAVEDVGNLIAGIGTIAEGILIPQSQARADLTGLIHKAVTNPGETAKELGDAFLSTYNLTIDELGKAPLGETVGNIMTGIWQHPVSAFLDIYPMYSAIKGVTKGSKLASTLDKASDLERRAIFAEQTVNENVKFSNQGQSFIREVEKIEKRYNPQTIATAMEAIETIGFKGSFSKEVRACMNDLSRANDTYKSLVAQLGGKEAIMDDIDFATQELMTRQSKIAFSKIGEDIKSSQTYQNLRQYVVDNDIRPLFHLSPKIAEDLAMDGVESELFKRKYGTIDYKDAVKDLTGKAFERVDAMIQGKMSTSIDNINRKIEAFNKTLPEGKTPMKTLDKQATQGMTNKLLQEANSELKKVMLSTGTYLGANIIATTLSILNNFDGRAFVKTVQNLPKFRLVKLKAAETPILHQISQINNVFYRPAASVDRWLEAVASEYIANHPNPKTAQYMQSAIPTKIPTTSSIEGAMKALVPFGSYPAAALKELVATTGGRPYRALVTNELRKLGIEENKKIQEEQLGKVQDLSKQVRKDERDPNRTVQRSMIVTPLQAANMFLLGQQGDAVQIPIYQFINKLVSGAGDPNTFEIEGKSYKLDHGKIRTSKGEFDLGPAIIYAARNVLSPVKVYNEVITPLYSDKYIKDDTKLLNQMVTDAQYANLGARSQHKVTDRARERLANKARGVYEYDYYNPRVSKRVQKKMRMKINERHKRDRILNQ